MVRTIAERLAGEAAVGGVNTRENPQLAARFQVSGIPVIFLLKNGQVVDKLQGARPADSVVAWFRSRK